jgi:single-stranded-DNA-specific exonuclease
MFNAPGRVLGNVDAAMEVLVASRSGNIDRAREAVQKLIAINEERKTWSKEDDSLAFKQAENYSDNRFMLVANDSFREGINGLTSSHLTEKYQVPSIVLSPVHGSANIYKGSGRSVDGINLFSILDQCRDLMLGFGGHPMAAGLSVEKKNIEKLRKRLNKLAPENPDKGAVTADFTVDPSDITLDLIDEYETLMPFGPEFEKPTFLIEGRIESIRTMKDKHIKIGLETANGGAYTIMDILWWNCMEQYKELGTELKPGDTISVLGTPEASTFNNERRIQMVADKVNLY